MSDCKHEAAWEYVSDDLLRCPLCGRKARPETVTAEREADAWLSEMMGEHIGGRYWPMTFGPNDKTNAYRMYDRERDGC